MMLVPVHIAPSRIHGNGLMASEFIPQGTPVWRFQAGFDQVFSIEQWAALPESARDHLRHFCFLRKEDHHLVRSGDHACFMNHSDTPNTGAPAQASEPVTTVALRDIAAGAELTCDYCAFDADAPWKLGWVPRDATLGASRDQPRQNSPTISNEPVELPIDGVLDLHAFRPRDVKELVPGYLEECRSRGILRVRIIHGKGIGQLRETVHAILKRLPEVESFALAGEAFGGWGATIVHLRRSSPA